MFLKKLPKHAVVPMVKTKSFTGWVAVEDVQEDPVNSEVYNFDSLDNIAESIRKDGLHEIPKVWKNTFILNSGHTRLRAFKKLGYTHIPVMEKDEEIPASTYERIKNLHITNIYREMQFADRYRGVKAARQAYYEEHGGKMMDEDMMTDLCSSWGLHKGDWTKMEEMRVQHPTFYHKVLDGNMGVRDAYKTATQKAPKMRMARDLTNLLNKQDVNYMITSIAQTVMGIKTLDTGLIGPGETFTPLSHVDQNFYSTAIHATACSYLANRLRTFDEFADDWRITDNQNTHHDVWSATDDTGVEVKTNQAKAGETPRWTPKRFKEGYHLLIATSPPNMKGEIMSIFIGFGKIDKSCVKPITEGKVEILSDKLYEQKEKGEFEVWRGKMTKDRSGKVIFYQDTIR